MSSPSSSLILIVNDLEMSGPRLHENFCVSWGSVAYDSITRQVLSEHLVQYIKPENDCPRRWDKDCKDQFWLKDHTNALAKEYERVERGEGMSVHNGTKDKVNWINQVVKDHAGGDPHRVLFVSDTCAPDNMWMNMYLSFVHEDPIQYFFGFFRDTFSTSSYALGLLRQGLPLLIGQQQHFSEDKMVREHLQIPNDVRPTAPHDHNPINDCKNIMEEFWIHCDYAEKKEKENVYDLLSSAQVISRKTEIIHLLLDELKDLKKDYVYHVTNLRESKKNAKNHPKTEDCPNPECFACGERDCPHGEPLHYDKDGCPACETDGEHGTTGMETTPPVVEDRTLQGRGGFRGSITDVVLLDNNHYRIKGASNDPTGQGMVYDNRDEAVWKLLIVPYLIMNNNNTMIIDGRTEEEKNKDLHTSKCLQTLNGWMNGSITPPLSTRRNLSSLQSVITRNPSPSSSRVETLPPGPKDDTPLDSSCDPLCGPSTSTEETAMV